MRLDPDCVRDILLTVEENTSYSKGMEFSDKSEYPRLDKYPDYETILYHVNQCKMNGFFTECGIYGDRVIIMDLSPRGHEFLSNIREDKNWKSVLQILKTVGSFSLSVIEAVAAQVITSQASKIF